MEGLDAFTAEQEGSVLYRLYRPEASVPRPLILFLHGVGESGNDNFSQMVGTVGAIRLAERYPDMYIMAPQAPARPKTADQTRASRQSFAEATMNITYGWTRTYLSQICDIIRKMIAAGQVDPHRVYVTGLSMGGGGALCAMSVGADLFAASAPVCPTMTPESFAILRGLTHGKLTLVASGETFVRLTGVSSYSLVMVQTASDITDENVQAIQDSLGGQYQFRDKRDESTAGTYLAFVACVYGFLTIITLVTLLNIINSISMSVSARMKQYGAMRAVGMDEHQITKMILAEAFTYAFWGCIVGCVIGLPLSKLLYGFLITEHFPYATWSLPVTSLIVILLFVILAAVVVAYAPARRIRSISVTETINEL